MGVFTAVDGRAELVNLYPEAVRPRGNRVAQDLLERVFEPAEVPWRGLSRIPESGLVLRAPKGVGGNTANA